MPGAFTAVKFKESKAPEAIKLLAASAGLTGAELEGPEAEAVAKQQAKRAVARVMERGARLLEGEPKVPESE